MEIHEKKMRVGTNRLPSYCEMQQTRMSAKQLKRHIVRAEITVAAAYLPVFRN